MDDSQANPAIPPLTTAQLEEIERRLRDADLHPDDTVSWEEVKEEMLVRLREARANQDRR